MTTWIIDQSHSEIHFKVRHLVVSTVTGSFKSFEGRVEVGNEDFTNAKIFFSADIGSISTSNEQRDGHLASGEFFDAEKHPKLFFVSTEFTHQAGSSYLLKGNLTIKGVTKPIELEVEHGGIANDLYGNTVAAFELLGRINRQDFGLTWSALTETGGAVVSDEVKLQMNIELRRTTK